MRFTFFEYVFFVSAFGTLAFFPSARPLLPLLTLPAVTLSITLTGLATFAWFWLYEKTSAQPTRARAVVIAVLAGCVVILINATGSLSSPAFALWSLNAVLATFSFGSILARRFFRRVERDFRRNASHILIIGLAINAAGLLAVNLFTVFPVVLIAILTAVITFIALS